VTFGEPPHELERSGVVVGVHRSGDYTFSKPSASSILLIAGVGVEGDAHAGASVKHRSRVRANPDQPNLRQVHLLHAELFQELTAVGYQVSPGELGENITTEGVDLLGLPAGAMLRLGEDALVAVTGLRNPCKQIDGFSSGLLEKVLSRSPSGEVIRKAGVMGVVVRSGTVSSGDPIRVALPPEPHNSLEPV
jgi:MOSC domain-containing protein YiiM